MTYKNCPDCGKPLGADGDIHTCTPKPQAEPAKWWEPGFNSTLAFTDEAQPATQQLKCPDHEDGCHRWDERGLCVGGTCTEVSVKAQPTAGEPVAQPTCVAIIEVFDREWHMKYLSLPVGTHKLYAQQYTFTAPQPRKQLTPEQLRKMHHEDQFGLFCDYDEFEQIARAIEAAIGGQA